MKKIFSLAVMLMMVGVMMAEDLHIVVNATFCQEGHDAVNDGYKVVFNEDRTFFQFFVPELSQLEDDEMYSNMSKDMTFAYTINKDATADTIRLDDAELTRHANGNFTALFITAENDSFFISYVKPLREVSIRMDKSTSRVVDYVDSLGIFDVVAETVEDSNAYALGLAIQGATAIEGVYYTSDVLVGDSAGKKTYTRLRHSTGAPNPEFIEFRALAPTAEIHQSGDTVYGDVDYLGMDTVLYHISFVATIRGEEPTAVEDVTEDARRGSNVYKYYYEGRLYIVKDGVTYDMMGRIVK